VALVEDPIQQQRRVRFDPLQVGDVDRAADDVLQADGELESRRGTIVGKRRYTREDKGCFLV
jgi:hypothetical protein